MHGPRSRPLHDPLNEPRIQGPSRGVGAARRTRDRGIIVRSGQSVQEVPDGWFSASISVGVKTVPRSTILEGRVGLECTYGSDQLQPRAHGSLASSS